MDILGAAYVAKRPLDIPAGGGVMNIPTAIGGIGGGVLGGLALNGLLDAKNLGPWHEQIVYEDGKEPSNEGFFDSGRVGPDPLADRLRCCEFWTRYDDDLMRKAIKNVSKDMEPYNLLSNNCQDLLIWQKKNIIGYVNNKTKSKKRKTLGPILDLARHRFRI